VSGYDHLLRYLRAAQAAIVFATAPFRMVLLASNTSKLGNAQHNAYIGCYNRIVDPSHRYCVSTAGHRRYDTRNFTESSRADER